MGTGWNHLMEACFSEFIDGSSFDNAAEAVFQLARAAFAEGYRVGVISEQGRRHMESIGNEERVSGDGVSQE